MGLVAIPVLLAAYLGLLWGVIIPADRRRLQQPSLDAASLAHVGDAAPSFSLNDVDGREFSLDALRGKVVILNFFATWCGPCVEEMPSLQAVWDDHRNRDDFAMIIIGREEMDDGLLVFRRKRGYTLPMGSDEDGSIYSRYAKELIPRTYLVDRNGTISFSSGFLDQGNLRELRKELAVQLRAAQ